MSAELHVPLATVCRLTEAPRSTVYARRVAELVPAVQRKRGPKTALSDSELTERIKEVIWSAPFAGEGHRKVTARLRREHGIRVGRKRVLRLMRQAGLLAPQRARGRRKPRPHDGTIIPPEPNLLWGTDATMAYTVRDGWVWAFVAIDLVLHRELADLAFSLLQPSVLRRRRLRLQALDPAGHEVIAPSCEPVSLHAELPGDLLQVLTSEQAHHRVGLAPGRPPDLPCRIRHR